MLALQLLVTCSFFLLLHKPTAAIPLQDFYPFGNVAGDLELASNDDLSTPAILLSSPFPFFGSTSTALYVNNNGVISFDNPVSTFTPLSFPIVGSFEVIAPYWADVDTRNGGRGQVWYRESSEPALLMRAMNDIDVFVGQIFQPTYLFIATWESVSYFADLSGSLRNTFQCILVSDGLQSFAIFLYADGMIQWTTGDASGGSGGLGGTPAQVGFNAGDGIRFASVPGSQTPDIINIDTTSNVGQAGVWVFQVDDEIVIDIDCGTLPDPLNGQVVLDGTEVGSTAQYSCGLIFHLVGMATRMCESNGMWSGVAPTCESLCPIIFLP